jgi:Xaa-Pro dipeptidase
MEIPKENRFSRDEYKRRLDAVRTRMAAQDIEALLIFSAGNVYYLTGYHSVNSWDFQCCILTHQGDPTLLIFNFELGRFLASSWLSEAVLYTAHDNPVQKVIERLNERHLLDKRLGIEENSPNLGVRKYRQFQQELGKAQWIDASGLVDKVRLVKSSPEIEYMRAAARLTCMGAEAALAMVAEGVYDHDVSTAAYSVMRRNGSDFMCIDPIVAVGYRSGLAHSTLEHIPIRSGDSVFIELGACVCRYTAPLMRTTVVGPVPAERQEMLEAAQLAVQTIVETAKAGVLASDVAHASYMKAIKPIEDRIQFHYNFGYSVGIGFPPDWLEPVHFFIQLHNHTPLEAGMIFHLPFTLRVLGVYGAGTSETILITPTGCEVLTQQ